MEAAKRNRILVIDDDDALCDVIIGFFELLEFDCYVSNGVTDILPIVEEFNPDLIILDYLLPGINGGELCSQIKRNLYTCKLPVVIYTAYPRILCSLGNYGCDAFLEKPFDLEDLKNLIKSLIKSNSCSCLIMR